MTLTATGASKVPSGTAPPDWAAFADQIRRENAEVLYPLLDRMEEVARRLDRPERVDPDYIESLIQLWSSYVDGLHRRRVAILGDLVRPLGPTPTGKPHGFHLRRHNGSGAAETSEEGRPIDTPQGQYDRIARDHERTGQRIGVIQSLIRDYRHEQYMSHQLLSSLLRSSAFADRAWAGYEESFARQNIGLPATSPAASGDLESSSIDPEAELARLGKEVRAFLARPIPSTAAPAKA